MSEQAATYSSSNPQHIKSRKRRQDRVLEELRNAWKYVLSDPRGRRCLWDIIDNDAGTFKQPFNFNQGNATDYNCGRQYVGQKILAKLEENFPEEYSLMWQEKIRDNAQAMKLDKAARVPEAANGEKPDDGEKPDE